jgi:hypothetical protein
MLKQLVKTIYHDIKEHSGWYLYSGPWWMIQWSWNGWISFGVHLDFRRRYTAKTAIPFGPYVDIHLGFIIFSFGVNPKYSGELDASVSVARGGERSGS